MLVEGIFVVVKPGKIVDIFDRRGREGEKVSCMKCKTIIFVVLLQIIVAFI